MTFERSLVQAEELRKLSACPQQGGALALWSSLQTFSGPVPILHVLVLGVHHPNHPKKKNYNFGNHK